MPVGALQIIILKPFFYLKLIPEMFCGAENPINSRN